MESRPTSVVEVGTSWGMIVAELHDGRVVCCDLPHLASEPTCAFAVTQCGNDSVSRFIRAALTGKAGKVPSLETPAGTEFQQQVWMAIAAIPHGQTRTYGELAASIGRARAVRAVGMACGRNPLPLFIPCHRVVAANGKPGGFSAGLPWKEWLLRVEQRI